MENKSEVRTENLNGSNVKDEARSNNKYNFSYQLKKNQLINLEQSKIKEIKKLLPEYLQTKLSKKH